MTEAEAAAVYDASARLHRAAAALADLSGRLDGVLPLEKAEACLDMIQRDIASIRNKLNAALRIIDAEVKRLETLPELRA